MRPYLLAECNWKSIKDRSIDLAILPWGAAEAHNYHLPYSSDIIESYHIASTAAEKAYNKGAKILFSFLGTLKIKPLFNKFY